MSINQLRADQGPPDSAIQNRLTVAGLILTTLFFAGSFALALSAQFDAPYRKDFRTAFAYLEVTLVVGALLSMAAITGLLACQQLAGSGGRWYASKRAWFIISTNCLYLALSQAMSAGLTELVFGIRHVFEAAVIATTLAIGASFLWVVLLFVAPIHALASWWSELKEGEKILCVSAYVMTLGFVLFTNSAIYLVQNQSPETLVEFLYNLFRQIIQPLLWLETWDRP